MIIFTSYSVLCYHYSRCSFINNRLWVIYLWTQIF